MPIVDKHSYNQSSSSIKSYNQSSIKSYTDYTKCVGVYSGSTWAVIR